MKLQFWFLPLVAVPINAGLFDNFFFSSSETLTLEDLKTEFPDVDHYTIARFHSAFGVESGDKLHSFLEWKAKHTLTWNEVDTMDDDTRWNLLVEQSIQYLNQTSPELVTGNLIKNPPRFPVVYFTNATDYHGNVIFQLLPKRMRLDHAFSAPVQLYTDVLASYLDMHLQGGEKATLMIDFRPGRGWDNTQYSSLLGAIRDLGQTLKNIQPERVAQTLAFPMPAYGRMMWRIWKPVIGTFGIPLELIPGGSAKLFEPVPKEGLMKYMDGDVVDQTEALRLSLWRD